MSVRFNSYAEMFVWGACVACRLASYNTSPEEAMSWADQALNGFRYRAEKLGDEPEEETRPDRRKERAT